jgi:hypothetical protein
VGGGEEKCLLTNMMSFIWFCRNKTQPIAIYPLGTSVEERKARVMMLLSCPLWYHNVLFQLLVLHYAPSFPPVNHEPSTEVRTLAVLGHRLPLLPCRSCLVAGALASSKHGKYSKYLVLSSVQPSVITALAVRATFTFNTKSKEMP